MRNMGQCRHPLVKRPRFTINAWGVAVYITVANKSWMKYTRGVVSLGTVTWSGLISWYRGRTPSHNYVQEDLRPPWDTCSLKRYNKELRRSKWRWCNTHCRSTSQLTFALSICYFRMRRRFKNMRQYITI